MSMIVTEPSKSHPVKSVLNMLQTLANYLRGLDHVP